MWIVVLGTVSQAVQLSIMVEDENNYFALGTELNLLIRVT
jgi:hypothetical protein